MPKRTWTDQQLVDAVQNSTRYSEIFQKLNLHGSGELLKRVKKKIIELNLSTTHFSRKTSCFGLIKEIPLSQILIENSDYKGNGQHLKQRLLKAHLLIKDECELCKQGPVWNNKPLVLQLDHRNGIRSDNRIENLRILCPNCHTQTDTFGCKRFKQSKIKVCVQRPSLAEITSQVKRRKIKDRPSKETLLELLKTKSYCEVGRVFGVSDNTIRKWIK